MSAKISLQDAVSTICDALADLSPDDQTRALEAVRLTLGLGEPVAQAGWSSPVPERLQRLMLPPSLPQEAQETELSSPLCDPSMFQEKPAKRLPTVVVQMMGDRPMVVGQQVGRPGRTLVAVGPQRDQRRQLPPPRSSADASLPEQSSAQAPYRGGYVLRRR